MFRLPSFVFILLVSWACGLDARENTRFASLFDALGEIKPGPEKVARPPRHRTAAPKGADDIDLHALLRRVARDTGLPPALIAALVRIESAFDPCALSPAGAAGLMQLMPATARRLGVRDRYRPQENVAAGARLFADLLRLHGGLYAAAGAYNAGPRYLAQPWARWPTETRNYLRRLLRAYRKMEEGGWEKLVPATVPAASNRRCTAP